MRSRRGVKLLVPLALVAAVVAAVVVIGSSGGDGDSHGASRPGRSAGAREPAKPAPPRIVKGPHDKPVPILMYHVIAEPEAGAPYPELYTPGPVFRAQMRALARRGYHGVTLGQVERYWRKAYALPDKPIVVSFDDGYVSHYTRAAPALKRLGWPGVLNLEVNNVRNPGNISPHRVEALIRDGWEVDSHTVTHPDLTALAPDQLRRELVESRSWLRRRFHVPVDYFCYPSGRFDATVVAAVRRAGYRLATTTQAGLASPGRPLELARIRVDGADGVDGLLEKMAHPETAQSAYPGG
jgi:peptidoglycan/xylan/chitin deacetylase (PgdA/CDA1 family)